MLEELLEKRRQQAQHGRDLWLSFVKQDELENGTYALLLPPDTPEYHEPALKHLPEYLKRRNAKGAVVLDVWEKEDEDEKQERERFLRTYSPLIQRVGFISREDYEALLRFYCLYEFTDRLLIASLEEPDGRLGKNMIGKKDLTIEDLIRVTLYD